MILTGLNIDSSKRNFYFVALTMVELLGEIERISGILKLVNGSNRHVAFQVKMTHPNPFCASPNMGIIKPRTTLYLKRVSGDRWHLFSLPSVRMILSERDVFVDANPKAETRSETKEDFRMKTKEDSKLNEAQQLISMKLEIEKLRIQLNKAEETISELKHQPFQPMPSCCFFKCFNFK
nr:hypothetical protein [Tanacetum cinerariifolium]